MNLDLVSMGSPFLSYDGKSMSQAHKRLVLEKGLGESHFKIMVQLLKESLEEMCVSTNLINEVTSVAESVRHEILCKDGCYSETD